LKIWPLAEEGYNIQLTILIVAAVCWFIVLAVHCCVGNASTSDSESNDLESFGLGDGRLIERGTQTDSYYTHTFLADTNTSHHPPTAPTDSYDLTNIYEEVNVPHSSNRLYPRAL